MKFAPGNKASPGRPKGVPNKTTIAAKEAIQAAFDGLGGVQALIAWAKTAKGRPIFYGQIYPKILPLDVKHAGEIQSVHSYAVPETRPIVPPEA